MSHEEDVAVLKEWKRTTEVKCQEHKDLIWQLTEDIKKLERDFGEKMEAMKIDIAKQVARSSFISSLLGSGIPIALAIIGWLLTR